MFKFNLKRFLIKHPGGTTLEEGLALNAMAAEVFRGVIVEIGSSRGKSAVALAEGLSRSPVPKEFRHVFCIDPHEEFEGIYGGQFGPEDRGAFFRAMLKTGYYRLVSLINLPSVAAARAFERPIELLFIDGDHATEAVRRDVKAWMPHVIDTGTVVFDDAGDSEDGPGLVVRELVDSGAWVVSARPGKMIAIRRT